MKRVLLTALALTILVCAFSAAEAAAVRTTGSFVTEINMTVEPQFAYQISSSDLTFNYGDEAQTLTLTLLDRVLYRGDAVRVTAPVSVALTDSESDRTLPVRFLPVDAESMPEGETAVYDFDENGLLELTADPDWTDAKSGVYTGKATISLAVESNSGFDYEGTAASRVDIILPLTVNVDACTITVYVGEGGSVKNTEDGDPITLDEDRCCRFSLGRSETAALWLVPDEGYSVGEVLIDPDEEQITREGDKITFTEIQKDTTVTLTFVPSIVSVDLDAHLIEFSPDGVTEHKLSATIAPDAAQGLPLKWTSSDADVAAVDETGLVFIPEEGSCGSTLIRCASQSEEDVFAECAVIVHSSNQMVLPSALKVIEEEAFAGTAATEFVLPEGITTIGARAFAQSNAKLVKIINKEIVLDDRAFEGCEGITLFCPKGSNVESFARSHNLRCILYDEP